MFGPNVTPNTANVSTHQGRSRDRWRAF